MGRWSIHCWALAEAALQGASASRVASERDRIFDRFYRLERSRSTPGSGLGLALVAAVARLHGATVTMADASPGLDVRVAFAGVARTGTLGFSNEADSASSARVA